MDENLFVFDLPICTIALDWAEIDFGPEFAFYIPERDDGNGKTLLLFTDNDLADSFLAGTKDGEMFSVRLIESTAELLQICRTVQTQGCRYVCFDFTRGKTFRSFEPIEDLIEMLSGD